MTTQTLTQRVHTLSSTSSSPPTAVPTSLPMRADGRGFPTLRKATPGLRQFTWEEVAAHNTAESCWVYQENRVYDITPWLDRHPGGRDVLLLVAGRDVTDLLPSYHAFRLEQVQAVLAKFQIGEIATTEFPQYMADSGFYAEVRREVGNYFRDTRYDPKDPLPGLWRLALILTVAALSFSAMVFGSAYFSFAFRFLCAIAFGVCQALPLLHCMHDASHTAIGQTPGWWFWIGRLTMDWFAGASINSWHNQHILGHHVYTNVMGVDPDLPISKSGDIRRVSTWQEHAKHYRYQHIYLCILYGALAIKFRIQDIVGTLIDKSNGRIRVNDLGMTETVSQIASKLFWFSYRFILPVHYAALASVPQFLFLSFIAELTTGYYLTFNFQVSHVSPVAAFPEYEKPQFTYEWAPSQLLSTVDYAHDSSICTFLCGALNYQSIHHLFPGVSQYYYPALAPIVQRVAKKHGIRYNYVGSFTSAFKLHLEHLQNMGIDEEHSH